MPHRAPRSAQRARAAGPGATRPSRAIQKCSFKGSLHNVKLWTRRESHVVEITTANYHTPVRLGARERQRLACNLSRDSNHRLTAADRKAYTYNLRGSRTTQNLLDMVSPLAIHSPRTTSESRDQLHPTYAHHEPSGVHLTSFDTLSNESGISRKVKNIHKKQVRLFYL